MNENLDLINKEISIQKMNFIYNALMKGWSVRAMDNNKFEFKKTKQEFKKEICIDDYLNNFINENLDIENL